MNPTKRRRRSSRRKLYGAAAKAHAKKSSRRRSSRRTYRKVRRNPVARRKSSSTSAATRAKISRAVKAANRRRKGGSLVRRSITSLRTRRSSRPRRSLARRSVGGGGGGGIVNQFKQMFSKQVLTVAGGAVASSFVTQFILTRYGASLPMANQPMGRFMYKLLIPVAGAAAVKRVNRDLASGMLIGGAVMAINELIAMYGPKTGILAPMKSYGDEYEGEADYATDTYMADVATGMPSSLSEGDEELGEYFQGDNPFDSAPAFNDEF